MDPRYLEYASEPNSDNYKGYELDDSIKQNKVTVLYQIVLTNGNNRFMGSGYSFEESLSNAFDKIDKYINE